MTVIPRNYAENPGSLLCEVPQFSLYSLAEFSRLFVALARFQAYRHIFMVIRVVVCAART